MQFVICHKCDNVVKTCAATCMDEIWNDDGFTQRFLSGVLQPIMITNKLKWEIIQFTLIFFYALVLSAS